MEIYIILLLTVILAVMIFLYVSEHTKRIETEKKNSENHKLLKKYISENTDMNKYLESMEEKISRQSEMAEEIKNLHERVRLLKHDMKNHMMVLMSYIENSENEKAKEYISLITDKLNRIYSYIYIGNSLMNYIINNKADKAINLGIDIKAEIETLDFKYMDSIDFSSLLNNIFDNAIEAAEKSEDKRIEINISNKNGFDLISIKNSIDKSVLKNNPEFKTTKSVTGHGYGMKQIKGIVEKYNGALDIYEDNGLFCLNVVYPS